MQYVRCGRVRRNERGTPVKETLSLAREVVPKQTPDIIKIETCVYRKLKPGRSDGEARRGSGVNE